MRKLHSVVFVLAALVVLAMPGAAWAQCPSPSQGATPSGPSTAPENTAVTFTWRPASASLQQGYEVYVRKAGDTANVGTLACSAPTGASQCSGGSFVVGNYEFMVRTKVSACTPGLDSTYFPFTVSCTPPGAPTLVSPVGTTNEPITTTLKWNAATGATTYDVYLETTTNGGCQGAPRFTTTGLFFNPPQLAPGTAYEWKVVAKNGSCSTPSTCSRFTTASCPTAAPAISSPASGATVPSGPVTISWGAVAGVTGYNVFLGVNGATPTLQSTVTATSYSTLIDAGRSVEAYVEAVYPNNCPSQPSAHVRFSTEACPSGTATLTSPAPGAQFDTSTPVGFSWSAVAGASSYDLLLALNGGAFQSQGTTTGTAVSKTLPAGSYEWKVQTKFGASCPATESPAQRFAVVQACPSAPLLNAPAAGVTVAGGSITFSWSAVANASGYELFVGLDGAVPAKAGAPTTNSFTLTIPDGKTVEWYVNALVPGCSGLSSEHRRFSTASSCPSTAPVISTPTSGSTFTDGTPIGFSWSAVAGATSYSIMVSKDGGGTFTIAATVTVTSANVTLPVGSYIAMVDANFPAPCGATHSTTVRFTVAASTQCPTAAPTLTAPATGATLTAGSITLQWTAVPNATAYEVFIGKNGATPSSVGSTAGTQATFTVNDTMTIEWYVRASAAGCNPVDSAHGRFNVQSACSNAAPMLTAPAEGAIVTSPVTFEWQAVAGATGYRVFAGGSSPSLIGTTTATRLVTSTLPQGTLSWYVQATFDNCPATESARRSVTVSAANNCPTDAPVPVSPANGASVDNPVHFVWRGVASTTAKYRLMVSVDGATAVSLGIFDVTEHEVTIPGSVVEWWVEAVQDTTCPAVASAHARFTIAVKSGCPANPGSPKLVSPAADAANVASPVTLQWTSVSGATGYRVLASINGAALTTLGTTTGTSLTASLPAGSIVWLVQAFFGDDCPSTFSSRATFTVTSGSSCNNGAPTPLSPPNGATGVVSPVEFRWTPVTGAASYKLYVSIGGELELVGETSETSLTRLVPAASVKWLVVATFAGCPDTRSNVATFTVVDPNASPAATISRTAPADGSTQGSPVTLSWTAVANATAYRVWVSIDGSAATLVANTQATSVSVALPSGAAEWWVEALRERCDSVSSSHGRFTVARATNCDNRSGAAPIAPSNSSVASPVTFQWSAAAGATGYQLWVGGNGQPFGDVGSTTQTQLARELPAGSYQWFVITFFEGCPPVRSAVASFTVTETRPRCSDAVPTLLAPADGAANVTSPVTFLWSAVEGASEYRVFAAADGASTPLLLGSTTDTTLTRALPPGTITWAVEVVFKECPSRLSARARFTIPRAQSCPTELPQLVAPANGATGVTSPVTFVWSPVSGAVRYVVIVKLADGAPTPIGETTATQLEHPLPAGKFTWTVIAHFSECPPLEARPFSFTVVEPEQCENRRPVLLTPRNGASNLTPPIHFTWTAVPRAKSYNVWASVGDQGASVIGSTPEPKLDINLPPGTIRWFVEAFFENCPSLRSVPSSFTIAPPAQTCRPPQKPEANVAGAILSGTPYTVRWTPLPFVSAYELQESTSLDFANATTQTVDGVSATFTHAAGEKPVQYLYRVRGVSACSDERGPYSDVVGVFILPQKPASTDKRASLEIGAQGNVVQTLFLPGSSTPLQFTARTDKPWLTVTPSSGVLGPEGVTLTVTADPSVLFVGTNTGTVLISYSSAGKGAQPNATSVPTSVPVSVSLVTPVAPVGRNTPLPESLIIPAVAHAEGANNSLFESDIRVANLSAVPMKYLVNFTPSGVDGTQNGSSTEIEVDPGATTAVDDILASFFGSGNSGSQTGMLEIRPLTTATTSSTPSVSLVSPSAGSANVLTTAASSRTFNATPNGTFGQFIPAIAYASFIGKSADPSQKNVISLQQIAQSAQYRTNFGFVEASGEPAEIVAHVFNDAGDEIAQIPVSLQASEHKQFAMLAANGITNLADGRVEVEVTSSTGKVTAYASEVDNKTNDPLLVSPVLKASVSSSRYVLPGVGDFDIGVAHWKSDLRLYNAAATPARVTLSYYAQSDVANPRTITLTLNGGEVKPLDDFIAANFGLRATAGSVVVSTSGTSSIVATARTYTDTGNGTYGQFIPGVTPAQAVGFGERALQILQVEHSTRFRTNIGLAETTGSGPATMEVSLVLPDSKATPVVPITLQPNEFRQISVGDFGLGNSVYNARVTVKVIDGSGRVTAYASNIDQQTQDPAFIPPQ